MAKSKRRSEPSENGEPMPEGMPRWVTRELLERTIHVWQRYYRRPLTFLDAADMLLTTGRLLNALS